MKVVSNMICLIFLMCVLGLDFYLLQVSYIF